MKKILLVLFVYPLFSTAQSSEPRFEKDTLYTSCGYKIYKGQILNLANGSSEAGYFRFVKFHYSMSRTDTYTLQNSSILVKRLRAYKNSGPDNRNIRISGTATFKDKPAADLDIIMDFDRVTESIDGAAAELTLPAAFKTVKIQTPSAEIKKQPAPDEVKKQNVPDDLRKLLVADEIKKLFDLYKAGALTKEEYEAQKKKLLAGQ